MVLLFITSQSHVFEAPVESITKDPVPSAHETGAGVGPGVGLGVGLGVGGTTTGEEEGLAEGLMLDVGCFDGSSLGTMEGRSEVLGLLVGCGREGCVDGGIEG